MRDRFSGGFSLLAVGLLVLVLALLAPQRVAARGGNYRMDVGFGLGPSSYIGDLSLTPIPYTVGGHAMGIFRFALNERYAFRGNVIGGLLRGRYREEYYLPTGGVRQSLERFSSWFVGGEATAEVHLRKFQVAEFCGKRYNPHWWTPFVFAGVGVQYVFGGGGVTMNIPMGCGVKFALGRRWTLAPELRFDKLFTDGVDGYVNMPEPGSGGLMHNRDWAVHLSVTVTYRLLTNVPLCPSYSHREKEKINEKFKY
ncbi:MAG: hypothetical protein CSA97_04995 [Bacteroidetes bacterium]|nr:MAG: hypothetical protein CSA97_04995 [Bacteroidota bacterium]